MEFLIVILVAETLFLAYMWFERPKKVEIEPEQKEIDEEVVKREKAIKKAFNELMEYDENKARRSQW